MIIANELKICEPKDQHGQGTGCRK